MRPGHTRARPGCALAIGGLDPGGGAGLAADLRAFAAAGAFGCAAVALVTVQSASGLRSARAVPARELRAQVLEVTAHQRVRAVKVGALGSAENVLAVAALLAQSAGVPVVVDTPMIATRTLARGGATRANGGSAGASGGTRLLDAGALAALRDRLLPRATLVTVNADEAEALVGGPVRTVGEAHDAARALVKKGARAALVKGGHLAGASAVDVLAVGGEVFELRAKRLAGGPVHGTGCTFASLVAGRLATRRAAGEPGAEAIVAAVRWAKRVHHAALAGAVDVGGEMRAIVF
ncbi:MAG TPA: bifunctional hydroxymethylpyrimidine kinase/phosphomethylpyrimidine kinase [Polyangiaceae bacterium]